MSFYHVWWDELHLFIFLFSCHRTWFLLSGTSHNIWHVYVLPECWKADTLQTAMFLCFFSCFSSIPFPPPASHRIDFGVQEQQEENLCHPHFLRFTYEPPIVQLQWSAREGFVESLHILPQLYCISKRIAITTQAFHLRRLWSGEWKNSIHMRTKDYELAKRVISTRINCSFSHNVQNSLLVY